MIISYKWLKDYIKIDLEVEQLSRILTDIGLEVGGIEEFESVKGGLKGLVVGEVVTCVKHENADSLSVTTVKVAEDKILPIVCGAPNVAAGQKVIVATVGTTLYDGDNEFKIKKSKIRGEVSEGMICAEDEIGMGNSHDGILELPLDTPTGTPANKYFNVESDTIFEIDLTPNRVDGASHIGVARDVAAYLKSIDTNIDYILPSIDQFKIDNNHQEIKVEVRNADACHRYSGLTINGLTIKESPEWLQVRLKSIGLTPINNVVDATNYILHELGQPLHAFDMAEVKNNTIIVDTVADKTKFTTLDEVERELNEKDLMICNSSEAMCMAGVFGGATSGVKETTTSIFLESAYFDSVWVRKTAKRHALNTDASFRFERGTDPNMTVFALKRAALLITEIAGGKISSEIFDYYPNPVADFDVTIDLNRVNTLIGEEIPKSQVIKILSALEIKINDKGDTLDLKIPPYRVDVTREADVVEEILRIYGYNTVAVPQTVHSAITYAQKPDKAAIVNYVSDYLSSNGFNEMMANSLTKANYYENLETFPKDQIVMINNPLSSDLNGMRQSLLFGALESVAYNQNHKNPNLNLYEFGNCAFYLPKEENENPQRNYKEEYHLALTITGNKFPQSWNLKEEASNFYSLKAMVEGVLAKLRIPNFQTELFQNDIWAEGLRYKMNNKVIVEFGILTAQLLNQMDIENDVYFAEFNFEAILKALPKKDIQYKAIAKFPEVRRDLALLVGSDVQFGALKRTAEKVEKKLLKKVNIFDVYEGGNIEKGKKSYAISFILQDENKTLNDKQVDKIMQKMIFTFEKEFGATIR